MSMLLLIGLTVAYIPFLERNFGKMCDNLPITGDDRHKLRNITADLVHKQTHLLQVLQPIETSPIVFARLDSEGDTVEGFEGNKNTFENDEIISISDTILCSPQKSNISCVSAIPPITEPATDFLPKIMGTVFNMGSRPPK